MDKQIYETAIKDAQINYGNCPTAKGRDALLLAIRLLRQRMFREAEMERRTQRFWRDIQDCKPDNFNKGEENENDDFNSGG